VSRGTLRRRLDDLEQSCPSVPHPSPEDRARQRRWEAAVGRWERQAEAAWPLLSPAEQEQVERALRQLVDESAGPLWDWLRDLREGCCRLPQLPPETTRALLLAWLSPEADGGMVCRACGLEYPRHKSPPLSQWKLLPGKRPLQGPPPWYDLPEFFMACPGCGGSRYEADWPWHTAGVALPWKQLDGFVGERPKR
jgi:hypothetical protein